MKGKTTAGRYLQAMAIARGESAGAAAYAAAQGRWLDRDDIVEACKASVTSITTSDFPTSLSPIAQAFLAVFRELELPSRLQGIKRTPMFTRVMVAAGGGEAIELTEATGAIPVLSGSWETTTLTPREFGAIMVATDELLRSADPQAAVSIQDDLATRLAERVNASFLRPDIAGSVLASSAPSFSSSGAGVAAVLADLKRLVDSVARPSAIIMTKETATFYGTLAGSDGNLVFPTIGPNGGALLNLPVLVTTAAAVAGSPTLRYVAVLDAARIFFADRSRILLTASSEAALKTTDDPDATAGNLVSLFQANATALRGIRECAWYAATGSGAYMTVGY